MTAETVAMNPQVPRNQATIKLTKDITIAMDSPHFSGIRPEGIGLAGSFMASTWRSHQSLAAWLIPQTNGPERKIPTQTRGNLSIEIAPVETAPQRNAHIGGNHVIGFINSNDVAKFG